MATKEKHLKKAQHNEQFLSTFDLNTTAFLDWVVTGIFYSALHYIRALAAKYQFTNISSYGEMDNLFSRISIFKNNPDIFSEYRQLKDDSRDARYEMVVFSPSDVNDLINNELQKIKSFILANL